MKHIVDLNVERDKRRPEYINREAIFAAVAMLDDEADAIICGSMERFGAIDPIAQEICALANAVRRVIAPIFNVPREDDRGANV